MKRIVRLLCLVGLGCTSLLSLAAQSLSAPLALPVKQVCFQRQADHLSLTFHWKMDSLALCSNCAIRLEPVLVKGDSLCVLKPIYLAGRKQAIMHRREQREGFLVAYKPGHTTVEPYVVQVPYRDWMNGANLQLMQDLCGCGGHPLSHHQVGSYEVWVEVPEYHVNPLLAFVVPQPEGIKYRQESGRAFLDFPVNQTVIYPHYRQNPEELEKIRHTVEVIKNDSNTHITQIAIHGYASPEGSWENNRRLAQGRAAALKQYVAELYHFEEEIFQVQSTPEDWEGLADWIRQSDLANKEEILKVLETVPDEDARNAVLQRMELGKTYARLLKEVYPALRHSDYTVYYKVRSFHLEEAKELVKTRPQLLSLQEMYDVAATYPVGSDEFNEVFATAVRMFPADEVANLNAALVCIQEKNYSRAARYLEKAGNRAEAVHARGILCLVQGQYDEAEGLLKQAVELGVEQAVENLHQLQLKRENNQKRKNL